MFRQLVSCLIFAFSLSVAGAANGVNYYISPYGSDTNEGIHPTAPWKTLNRAENFGETYGERGLQPGDTIFLMGGIHPTGQFDDVQAPHISGVLGNPIVFKAYGDSIAVFQYTGATDASPRSHRRFFDFEQSQDYITIDGFGKYGGDSLMIKLEGREDASYLISFVGTYQDRSTGNVIRGIEIDGNFPDSTMIAEGTPGGFLRYALGSTYGRTDTIMSCYVHDIYHPTGNIAPGDSTDGGTFPQGTGEIIMLRGADRTYIARNTFVNSNHAIIECIPYPVASNGMQSYGVKFVNNFCSNSWGGGIYFQKVNHCLIDGNIMVQPRTTTTKTKGPIGVAGENQTWRRNIVYNPYNVSGIDINGAPGNAIGEYSSDSCLVHNNVIYGTKGYDLHFYIQNASAPNASINRTIVANNIMYKGRPIRSTDFGSVLNPYFPSLKLYLIYSNNTNNWVDPDNPNTGPCSTEFGYNRIYNNIMLKDSLGAGYNRTISYAASPAEGSVTLAWSVAQVQALCPVSFSGNLEIDPLLKNAFTNKTTNLDTLFGDWWKLQPTSPCIDMGAVVYDWNGASVDSLFPGYGWASLPYYGSAPDIGAYEFFNEADSLNAPWLVMQPSTMFNFGKVRVDSTASLSLWMTNDCVAPCESIIVEPTIIGDSPDVLTITSAALDTLFAGDTTTVTIDFTPAAEALYERKFIPYTGALDTIPMYGVGEPDPAEWCAINYTSHWWVENEDIDYGNVNVGTTVTDTITIWNWGTDTLDVDVSVKWGTAFEIISGSGPKSLPLYGIDTVIVKVSPPTYNTYRDSLLTSSDACPGIKLQVTGYAVPSTKPTRPVQEE